MSDSMTAYTLDCLMTKLRTDPDSIKGLFQTNKPSGQLYAVMLRDGRQHYLLNVPTDNNEYGELHACEVMDFPDFVEWAVDPWDGEVNLEIE